MQPNNSNKLIVHRTDLIMSFLLGKNFTPLSIGLLFFLCVSAPLTIAGSCTPVNPAAENYVGYLENISWSLSIPFIFPLIAGLTASYYLEIPKIFAQLSATIRPQQASLYSEFIASLERWFNSRSIKLAIFTTVLALNTVYYIQILNKEPYQSWISNGELFKSALHTASGFSYSGLYSAAIQVALTYWVANVIWKSFVFSRGLILFFNKYRFTFTAEPLHHDRCCGLKKIGDTGMIFNSILFLIGIYISLKVIDKIVIQELPLSNDIGNPIFLGCYLFLAPLLFFLPLTAPHRTMKLAKENFLCPLMKLYDEKIKEIPQREKVDYEELEKLDALLQKLHRQIPVWPFNFKSLKSFFATVIIPLLPVLLPFFIKFITDLIKNCLQ